MSTDLPDIQICVADDDTFWPWFNWPDLANWTDKDATLVAVPIAGLGDLGAGYPLDAEETVLMALLKEVSLGLPDKKRLLVIPPLRFTVGPEPGCAFAIDPDVACDLIEEVGTSIGNAGFTRIIFVNASPWTEEVCKAAGRDLRIARGLQMFSVNLSALGLDFHPVRGGDRGNVKKSLAALALDPSDAAGAPGRDLLSKAAIRLASLMDEMRARPPLANGGVIPQSTWP